MTELFRKLVIKYFQEKKLINDKFAQNLLSWKNSGFSIDNSVMIYGNDDKAKEALAQYIATLVASYACCSRMQPGCPISLEKIIYEPFHGKVLFKTPKYNEYFKENLKSFDALDFIAEVTAHIPPKSNQYIRRYGLYSSRIRGIWERFDYIMLLTPRSLFFNKNISPTQLKASIIINAGCPGHLIAAFSCVGKLAPSG